MSWRDVVAFCRWLSARLGLPSLTADIMPQELVGYQGIRLPAEWEWQWAAQGPDGRAYPWGAKYWAGYANVDELAGQIEGGQFLKQTTAVDLYQRGASPYGVVGMSGNVWEWCLNEFDIPEHVGLDGTESRAVRGGAWCEDQRSASVSFRGYYEPYTREDHCGFRLCMRPASV